jgi:benzodiazapine receptor
VKLKNAKLLILSIAITESAGILGSAFTAPAIPTWYRGLEKPTFTPPNWIFGPVWTLLFLLMGIALYLVWGSEKKEKAYALKIFWFHLAANFMWSLSFFGLKSPLLGLVDIFILLGLIAYVMRLFWRINSWSAYLLVPYLLWTFFATLLNFSIWRLN